MAYAKNTIKIIVGVIKMPIYLEMPKLNPNFPFRYLVNEGDILTTPHWHKEIELVWLTRGSMNIGINDYPYHIEAGEVVIFAGGDIHYIIASPDSERLVFQFDSKLFSQFNELEPQVDLQQVFARVNPLSKNWPAATTQYIQKLLTTIQQSYSTYQIGKYYRLEAALCELVVTALRDLPQRPRQEKPQIKLEQSRILQQLDAIFQFVELNYSRKILLTEVAQEVGFSEYYFTRFFKKNTGKTFVEFLNEYRIDKAKWALIYTDQPILFIINEVGYGSDKTFYRVFKRIVKMTPKQYRARYQKL